MRRTTGLALIAVLALTTFATLIPAHANASQRTRVGVGVGYGPRYYRPVFYDPFAWGFYGYYGWHGYPWGPYPWGPYGRYPVWGYDPAGSVRIQSTPREAQVYVDGYFVGIVDDFDGWSQRLRLVPGEYEIQLYLEGYRTLTERMLLRPGTTYRIRRDMERLPPGAAEEPRPEPTASSGAPPSPRPPGPPPEQYPPSRHPGEARVAPDSGFGTIAVRVRPADAEVFVDGERWDRPAGTGRLTIDVAAGTHTVEVRREGHTTYTAQVDVRGGQVTTVNVSLPER